MGRAPCCDKTIVKKGPWSPEEDAILKDYIENYGFGGNWIALPQKIGINRCGKSCRLRWLNYLRPNIKHGGFSEEEDNIICSLYISIGSRWSIIAAQLPGRTDNDIKNYWNTKLKKKLLKRRKQSQPNRYSISSDDMKDSKAMEALSNSAIERLQLHMQLQGLVNPNTSNFANFPMWPCKLNPNQEQMIRNLHFLTDSSNPEMMQHFSHKATPQNIELDASPNNSFQQAYFPLNNTMVNEMDNLVNDESNISGSSTSHVSEPDDTEQRRMELQSFWVLQAEMDNFLANKRANIASLDQVQTRGFDDLKEMDCANSSMPTWSSNVFDWSILDLDN